MLPVMVLALAATAQSRKISQTAARPRIGLEPRSSICRKCRSMARWRMRCGAGRLSWHFGRAGLRVEGVSLDDFDAMSFIRVMVLEMGMLFYLAWACVTL